jgi:hypothetical protein
MLKLFDASCKLKGQFTHATNDVQLCRLFWFKQFGTRVTRLGEILPFGLLFKGLGDFLGENIVCFLELKKDFM